MPRHINDDQPAILYHKHPYPNGPDQSRWNLWLRKTVHVSRLELWGVLLRGGVLWFNRVSVLSVS